MSRNIPLQRLNKRQVTAYLRDNDCSLAPSLNSQAIENLLFVFDKTYQCADGKVLAVSRDGTGNLYGSLCDWQTELDELAVLRNRQPVHILYNQLPPPDKFIQKIPSLISKLAKELEVEPSQLDRTLDSLLIIDRAIATKDKQNYIDTDNKKILGSLIAYVGEVIKTAINGEWQIQQDNDPEVWEPVIVGSSGKISSFCIMVFDELYEAEESSFYDIASMLIESHHR